MALRPSIATIGGQITPFINAQATTSTCAPLQRAHSVAKTETALTSKAIS